MRFEGRLRDEFKAAVRCWAENHPLKDYPVLALRGDFLTPRQIADEVEKESPLGLSVIDMIELGATMANEDPEQVIARFRRPYQP